LLTAGDLLHNLTEVSGTFGYVPLSLSGKVPQGRQDYQGRNVSMEDGVFSPPHFHLLIPNSAKNTPPIFSKALNTDKL
jgi:hypothetical protein